MNAAGNADSGGNTYLQIFLTLIAWLSICASILSTNVLSRYGYIEGRLLYDAASISSFIVFIGMFIAVSMFKLRIRTALILSSILLAFTYYARLLYVASSRSCRVILLPLSAIVELENTDLGSLSLDLGQLGLYTFIYLTAKSSIEKIYVKMCLKHIKLLCLVKKWWSSIFLRKSP